MVFSRFSQKSKKLKREMIQGQTIYTRIISEVLLYIQNLE
jgi:hypothetical protein